MPDGSPLPRQGTATVLMRNAAGPSIIGRGTDSLITVSSAAGNMQVFAGLRDDPFFIDLEQFFRILPDRKPVSGGRGCGPGSWCPTRRTAGAGRRP